MVDRPGEVGQPADVEAFAAKGGVQGPGVEGFQLGCRGAGVCLRADGLPGDEHGKLPLEPGEDGEAYSAAIAAPDGGDELGRA